MTQTCFIKKTHKKISLVKSQSTLKAWNYNTSNNTYENITIKVD